MAYPIKIREQAIRLRKEGASVKEIAHMLHISPSTSSLWLSDVALSPIALNRLAQKRINGQHKSSEVKKKMVKNRKQRNQAEMALIIKNIPHHPSLDLLLCSFLYWGEGSKTGSFVGFTNSNPQMIAIFLKLFRSAFLLDEKKFHCLLHIHEYHNDSQEKLYWSKITNIPVDHFFNSYHKPHTSIRKNLNYHGTISVRYYDVNVADKINSIYNIYAQSRGVA